MICDLPLDQDRCHSGTATNTEATTDRGPSAANGGTLHTTVRSRPRPQVEAPPDLAVAALMRAGASGINLFRAKPRRGNMIRLRRPVGVRVRQTAPLGASREIGSRALDPAGFGCAGSLRPGVRGSVRRGYQSSRSAISDSICSGVTVDSKRRITLPSRPTRNFVKFHFTSSVPIASGRVALTWS